MNSQVSKIITSSSDPSKAEAVVVKSSAGEHTIPTDAVVMGVGVAPATEFLKSGHSKGFENALDKSGGVIVDEYLRVKGLEGVYAIGDIAMYPQPGTGELRRIEHWNVRRICSVACMQRLTTSLVCRSQVIRAARWARLSRRARASLS